MKTLLLSALLLVPQVAPPPPAPTDAPAPLTQEQKLRVQNIAQRIEIAQLRAQAAQAEFEKAREEFTATVNGLQRPGYTLDLQKMEYVKKVDEKPAAATPEAPKKK